MLMRWLHLYYKYTYVYACVFVIKNLIVNVINYINKSIYASVFKIIIINVDVSITWQPAECDLNCIVMHQTCTYV